MSVPGDRAALVIDLDGTLIRGDLFLESAVQLLRQAPWAIFPMLGWLSQGKAVLKREVAARIDVDPANLPYNEEVLALARKAKGEGRIVVLATAAAEKHARRVANHLALFDDVLSSGDARNFSGHRKAAALVEKYGRGGYDYAGNSHADREAWEGARHAIIVNAPASISARATDTRIEDRPPWARTLARQLRWHQWAKNLLLFLPAIAAHQIGNAHILAVGALAFAAYCLCSSAVYGVNDLLDIPHDRAHREKRGRPLAAGHFSVRSALVLVALLLAGSAALAMLVPSPLFRALLAAYFALSLAYAVKLKEFPIVDVILLALLYTLRVLAGGAAFAIAPSFWLLAFSVFFFFSLAVGKRYVELLVLLDSGGDKAPGRGYRAADAELMAMLGIGAGLGSVFVLALYVDASGVALLYRTPEVLWALCPLLLYWIGRFWLLAHRGEVHDDPVYFAVTDPPSYTVAAAAIAIVAAATLY